MFEIVPFSLFVCTLLMITCVPSEVPTSFKSKLGIQNKKGLKINSKISSKAKKCFIAVGILNLVLIRPDFQTF